jgi:hypothetical protein
MARTFSMDAAAQPDSQELQRRFIHEAPELLVISNCAAESTSANI